MSSKKNKGKNRQNKPPISTLNVCEEQELPKKEETQEDITKQNLQENINIEKPIIEVQSEKPVLPEESEKVQTDTPKKPKRSRGKKKKDESDDETNAKQILPESDIFVDLNKPDIDISENLKIVTVEALDVVPTNRKKKNKNKKSAEPSKTDIMDIKSEPEVQSPETETLKKSQDDENKSKKKNKKKKNRNDSEKTEEEISCTAAFQKILEPSEEKPAQEKVIEIINCDTSQLSKNNDSSNAKKNVIAVDKPNVLPPISLSKLEDIDKTALIKEDIVKNTPAKKEEQLESDNKTNKKNKKDKKHGASEYLKEPEVGEKHQEPQKVTMKRDDISSTKIEQVVEDDAHKKTIPAHVVTAKVTDTEVLTKSLGQSSEKINITKDSTPCLPETHTVAKSLKTDITLTDKPSFKLDVQKCKENIQEIENITTKDKEAIFETHDADLTPPQTTDTSDFILKRKKKKSPKLPILDQNVTEIKPIEEVKQETDALENITLSTKSKDQNTTLTKTTDNYMSPDFVDHPRCSSETTTDNNNNMVTKELITTDDINLNVPIELPETPFVRGSGETPQTSPDFVLSTVKIVDADISLVPIKEKEPEKTDLKSKVLEVNKDMEDLRMSIEKSLAEFTAIEKEDQKLENQWEENQNLTKFYDSQSESSKNTNPEPPMRKDNKGKGKNKKKPNPQPVVSQSTAISSAVSTPVQETSTKDESKQPQKDAKEDNEANKSQNEEKGKQKANSSNKDGSESGHQGATEEKSCLSQSDFEPIENFEDALSSSVDDVNKTFEIIANDNNQDEILDFFKNNPEINVTAPSDESEKDNNNENPLSQPKNLLGHPDIPVRSNKADYKKEKDKLPNNEKAIVKIQDSNEIENNKKTKKSKESQTQHKCRLVKNKEVIATSNANDDYVYKYSFRKVFLSSDCHVCKKSLKQLRVPCNFCNLVFYCSQIHKDEDYALHQALCFAVTTINHNKDQPFIYSDIKNVIGHDYRLARMEAIIACEKNMRRHLVGYEQEILLYPRICGDPSCREWRDERLRDCEGCGQIAYCYDNPSHLPKAHLRWCKSYSLYRKMVCYQQTKGRLEPKLPSGMMKELAMMPGKMNEVLASLYDEKIDMQDIDYAALTQIASAPLTTAYAYHLFSHKTDPIIGIPKQSKFTIHLIGAELQFEADSLYKWEVFFLHLRPELEHLRVVMVSKDLNPSNLPLDLLAKIRLCENCQLNNRRLTFSFHDKMSYHEYWKSDDFITPDIVCAFHPSIARSSLYNDNDPWPSAVKSLIQIKTPLIITSYTITELKNDFDRIKKLSQDQIRAIVEPSFNTFASVRPDRNFISDDETPLLFKNYCFCVVSPDLIY